MGKIARAFKAEQRGTASASVEAMCKVHDAHGERDSHRIFRRYGLALKVPVSQLLAQSDEGPKSIPYLKIQDFCSLLLRKHAKVLLGGLDVGAQSDQFLDTFWSRFQHFQGDHAVFEHPREEWKNYIPLMLHGDKGRGFSKKPVFCFSFEAIFGLPENLRILGARLGKRKSTQVHGRLSLTCKQRKCEGCPDLQEAPGMGLDCPLEGRALAHEDVPMEHNGRGHTYLSRFLITAVPHKVLQACPDLVWEVLKECAHSLTFLFRQGLQCQGRTIRFALVGCKGDYEFHHEAAVFDRCYARVGTVNNLAMCPECEAGSQQYPFTDVADTPSWTATLYRSLPWSTQPPLNTVPFSTAKPASLYRRDMFHTLKFGFLKDLAASVLIELSWLGMFDDPDPQIRESRALEARLQRSYGLFKLWCVANNKSPTLRKFSLGVLHRKKSTHMPFLGGKGSDSVLVLMYLQFLIPLKGQRFQGVAQAMVLLQAMAQTIQGALDFIGIHHSHGMFLAPYCGRLLHSSGLCLLRGYCFLADMAMRGGKTLYSLRPKLHYFAHTLWDLQTQLEAGHPYILNPNVFGCEQNEDWIGRVSRLSRKVSPKICSQRTIDRYLVGVCLLFRKHGL